MKDRLLNSSLDTFYKGNKRSWTHPLPSPTFKHCEWNVSLLNHYSNTFPRSPDSEQWTWTHTELTTAARSTSTTHNAQLLYPRTGHCIKVDLRLVINCAWPCLRLCLRRGCRGGGCEREFPSYMSLRFMLCWSEPEVRSRKSHPQQQCSVIECFCLRQGSMGVDWQEVGVWWTGFARCCNLFEAPGSSAFQRPVRYLTLITFWDKKKTLLRMSLVFLCRMSCERNEWFFINRQPYHMRHDWWMRNQIQWDPNFKKAQLS